MIKCRLGWIYHLWNLNFYEQDLLGNNHIHPVYTHSKVLSRPSWSCFWWFLNEWMRYDAVFCRLLQEVGTGVLESGVQSETRLISRNFGKHHWIFDDGTFYPRFLFFSPPLQSYLTDLNLVLIVKLLVEIDRSSLRLRTDISLWPLQWSRCWRWTGWAPSPASTPSSGLAWPGSPSDRTSSARSCPGTVTTWC